MKADLGGTTGVFWHGGGSFQEDKFKVPPAVLGGLSPDQPGPRGRWRGFVKDAVMRAEPAQWEGTAAGRNTGKLWNRGKADPIAEITSGSGFLPACLG